ncbi:MAG: hypothetical protein D6748_12660 [Calditrichaeota bacterium]|nr:MAG: hypothetical protein D6748_12660 [Calditrichota bacterium]
MRFLLLWIGLIFLIFPGLVAPVFAQHSSTLVMELETAYQNFDYPETDRLLSLALKEIDSFSLRDKIEIFKYAAFRQFQTGDSFKAAEFFWKLLEIDPTYSLDPVTTSPKLMTLFQKTKLDFLENLNQRISVYQQQLVKQPTPWRTLIFPGWEQYHRGYRWKGALWMTAGTGCLVGTIQAVFRTRQAKQDYEKATNPDDITATYNRYNRLYQSQFYWSYALIGVWISSQIDAYFFSPNKAPASLSFTLSPKLARLSLNISL